VRLLTFALRVTLLTCALLASVPGSGQTAPGLPDVDVVLIADVQDTAGWLTLHQEVLSTSTTSAKVLRVTLPARTGGSRSIDIEQPRFTVGLVTTKEGKGQVKVTVAGKLPASLALIVVTPFQQAAMEIHAGWVTNDISLAYGLSLVKGRLLELYFDRP
jgi:hypothetical protein